MKNDISKEIDLNAILEGPQESVPQQVQEASAEVLADFAEIVEEWSYRLPKGYPTMVDGVFSEASEISILNEILQERGLGLVESLAIAEIARPNTGTNDTSLKEGLVCLFYDLFKNSTLAKSFQTLHAQASDKKAPIDKKLLAGFGAKLKAVYKSNLKFYGVGKSMPLNLDAYVLYVLSSKQELDTLTNAASAAQVIHTEISSQGRIIRDQTFEGIRALASSLIKSEFKINLLPDNWCPGDVYLVVSSGADKKALAAETLNIGKDSLNAQFLENNGIVAISLKEEKAQAGKATTFAQTVFSNTFQANIDPNEKYGTSENKNLAKLSAKISRFEDYLIGKAKRPQSFINAISKDDKIHGSINTILQAAGLPTRKTSDIKFVKDEKGFYKANKAIFNDLQKAVAKIKKQVGGEDSVKQVESSFIKSREEFLKDLKKYKIEVSAESSAQFAKAIQKENEEPVSVLSKKQAAYELASIIMDRWVDKNAKISPAYKKIQEVSNPFVALTAFAIAQAGISPSFWKAIGNARSLNNAHADFFDSKVKIDIDTKTSKIRLVDSVGQSGFLLAYTTTMGDKKYATRLVFRFSGSEIRIEVQELKKL